MTYLYQSYKQRLIAVTSLLILSLPCYAKDPAAANTNPESPKNKASQTASDNGLSSEFIYKYLVGEIAGQRGDPGLASKLFLDLARSNRDPRLAERATRAALYGNQPQTAFEAATLWAELEPTSIEAQQGVMQMLVSQDKLDEAKPYLERLLTKEDTRANGFLYLTGLFTRSANKPKVFSLMQDLTKPYQNIPEAQFALGHAAWAANQEAAAIQALTQAETLRPGWDVSAVLHAQILAQKSPEAGNKFYQAFLDRYPGANEVRLSYARNLVNQKKIPEAKAEFIKLVDLSKSSPEILVIVGLLASQSGEYVEAETYFKQAVNSNFKNADQVYIYLGQLMEKQKRDQDAIAYYSKVAPGDHLLEAKLNIANVVSRVDGFDAGIRQLNELKELNSNQQTLVNQFKANLLFKAKRDKEGYDLLDRTIKTLPNTPEIVYDYALAAERMGKLDIMEKELRKLILIKPEFAAAYNALGYSYADRNIKLKEAKSLIEKALALSPDDYFILDSMGWIEYRLGNLEAAIGYLQRAYDAVPDSEIAAHIGEVLWKQGKKDEASKIWEEALQKDPEHETLRKTIKKFKP